jgi:hypothetical protein
MAVRLYTAGAIDYLASRPTRANAEDAADASPSAPASPQLAARAQRRFQAVLDLPSAQGGRRAVWAAYMLGQGYANAMGAAGADVSARRADAVRAYTLARTRAAGGAPDPLGLAAASFGEQARLFLSSGGKLCAYSDFANGAPCADGIAPADLKQAIRLYAEQAARGSNSGLQSLRAIAAWTLSERPRAARLIDDPLAQRLLVAYALARVGDIVNDDPASASDYSVAGPPGYADAARGAKGVKPNPMLQALVAALQTQGIEHVADADRLAALSYRVGRYDLAQSLADKQHSALSSWVRAKLALRRGDVAAAAQAYAEAARAFPPADASLEPAGAALAKAEQGVLTLSRGQYVEALAQLYAASSGGIADAALVDAYGAYAADLFYVAERVLTADELKTYVDAQVPATPAPPMPAGFAAMTGEQYGDWLAQHPRRLADRLRQLLARRLVREGRVDEALPYFPDDNDPRYVESQYQDGAMTVATWRLRRVAQEYGKALEDGRHAWRSVARAEGWYQAATLARQYGMDIMGYEQAPDFAESGGSFGFGTGRGASGLSGAQPGNAASVTNAGGPGPAAPGTPQTRAAADLPGPFVTDQERQRYAASEARPNRRFHYRDIAADHIMQAADLLPARSQAFAAVLCRGTGFVKYDAALSGKLYRRYVRQGAAVPFAADFGAACAEPDFRAAARFPYVRAWRAARHGLQDHRYAVWAAGLSLLLAAGAGAGWLVRRRRRAPAR